MTGLSLSTVCTIDGVRLCGINEATRRDTVSKPRKSLAFSSAATFADFRQRGRRSRTPETHPGRVTLIVPNLDMEDWLARWADDVGMPGG